MPRWIVFIGIFAFTEAGAEVVNFNHRQIRQTIPASGDPQGIIQPFNLEGVELLPGRLYDQFHQVKTFYLGLRNNDILKKRREQAGTNAPGKELGGAFGSSQFGQWLSGFARMYKVTGETAIKDKALYLMNQWAKTIEKNGNLKYGHYSYDKIVGGLVDVYEFIGDKKALDCLDIVTDWAEKTLDRSNAYALPSEWYTLSENLYRAYELTGEKRYYDFAKVWEYTDFWDILGRNESVFQEILKSNPRHESYHGYSHVNCFSSAAMAYKVTGEEHYLHTLINGYDFMRETQCYVTGGYAPEENFVVPDGLPETLVGVRRGESNVNVRFHFETSCGSWAGFKHSRYLQTFTGSARYGDWIERLVYNGVGAMVPMNDYGMIMYGSKYHLYGAQKSLFTVWFCCQGSLPETVTDYHNLIYYQDKKSIYVNLFVPSRVTWEGPQGPVTLVQETEYPEKDTVLMKIDPKNSGRFSLKFRVPSWADKGVSVQVNGREIQTSAVAGTWAQIDRKWESGDTVKLRLDLSPRLEPVPGCVSPVALLCGPVVMVQATARNDDRAIPAEGDLKFPSDWLMGEDPLIAFGGNPSRKAPVNPARQLHTNQVMRPFYDIKAGEYYRMYFERAGAGDITPDQMTFHGDWESRAARRYADKPGSSMQTTFKGTTLVWEGLRHKDAGIAEVKIDGESVALVDQYGYTDTHVNRLDQREVPFRWAIYNLGSGEHTVKVTLTSDKNKVSSGTTLNIEKMIAYH
jgi:hypothetical protein